MAEPRAVASGCWLSREFSGITHNIRTLLSRLRRQTMDDSNERLPVGYLITFRSYGTWLHGRSGSVDRFHNVYGTSRLPGNRKRKLYNQRLLKQSPVRLSARKRAAVLSAVRETCHIRKWGLWVCNVRSNHVHAVISAGCRPEVVLNALKANATRKMRELGCWLAERSPWARGGSRKYLWTQKALHAAVDYVLYDQGGPLPDTRTPVS
jgi:REP element-mobilizing transposase RayT